MEIFIIKKSDVLSVIDKSSINITYSSKKRNLDSQIGRFLVKYVADKFYNIDKTEILIQNKKPYFKYSDIKFSISHSHEFIGVAFSTKEIGFDIEKLQERNLEKLSKYFKKEFHSLSEFYKFWTGYEAQYKSGLNKDYKKTYKYKDYYLTTSSLTNGNCNCYILTIPQSISSLDLKKTNYNIELKETNLEQIL
jgi:hypothetical protein